MKPIKDRVIIKQDDPKERKSASGIVLSTQKAESPRGTIISVGPEVTEVKEGDIVLFNVSYHQKFTTADGEEYVTICDKDILAILPPETDIHMTKVS